jgi:hypothetical protein
MRTCWCMRTLTGSLAPRRDANQLEQVKQGLRRAVPTHEDRPERRHAVHRRIASVGPALAAQRMESAAVSQAKKAPKWVLEESRTIG